jgi:indolepyruvate ferredoxin oxidoreductase alpha subunit
MAEITGQEAIRLAVRDAGVEVVTWVPGYPITEVAEALDAEIAVNEKVALEIALGASATGIRSMVVVKQVGMNNLADPLVISATHTIGSGLVVLVGDDLGPHGSQAEMDSRIFGPLAGLPVLDPRDPPSLYSSIQEAYMQSECLRIPVIVRITKRLITSQGKDILSPLIKGSGQTFDNTAWDLTMRGRHQRHHQEVLPFLQDASESSTQNRVYISGDVGIIASGYPARLAEGLGVSLLSVGYAYPLPWKMIQRFVEGHRLILIAEEPEPFIESQLRLSLKVRGKLTGHLPYGPLERSDIIEALNNLENKARHQSQIYESVVERGYAGVCEDCPFVLLFHAVGKADVPVAGDAGCAIRATREPYRSVDVVYGLGSSIGVASGFAKKGIAVIGDYALAHTGLQGLVNAVWRKREVLLILLKNDMAAMTGGQEAPDLTRFLEMLVPTRRIELPVPENEICKILNEELTKPGSSLVVASGKCAKHLIRPAPAKQS